MAAELGNNAADVGQLVPMLDAVKANTGQAPEQALADAGYRSGENFKALADSGTELVVAMGREGKRCAEVDAQPPTDPIQRLIPAPHHWGNLLRR